MGLESNNVPRTWVPFGNVTTETTVCTSKPERFWKITFVLHGTVMLFGKNCSTSVGPLETPVTTVNCEPGEAV